MKIKGMKNLVNKEEVVKRMLRIAVLSLSTILMIESSKKIPEQKVVDTQIESLYDIKPLVEDIDPTLYSLSSCSLLIENKGNGEVEHHFVTKKEEKEEIQDGFKRNIGSYVSVSDNSYVIPCATYFYGDIIGSYETVPVNDTFIPDTNMKYQIVDKKNIVFPKEYSLNASYTKRDIKKIEEKLDLTFNEVQIEKLTEKYASKTYDIRDLHLLNVNGRIMIFDTSDVEEVMENSFLKTGSNLHKSFYMRDITNPTMTMKLTDGHTNFSEYLENNSGYFFPGTDYYFEKFTGMDQEYVDELNQDMKTNISLGDYLSQEQIKKQTITSAELIDVIEQIRKENSTHYM